MDRVTNIRNFMSPGYKSERAPFTPDSEISSDFQPGLTKDLHEYVTGLIETNSRLVEKARGAMERGKADLESVVKQESKEQGSTALEGSSVEEGAQVMIDQLTKQLETARQEKEAQQAAANKDHERMAQEIAAQAARMQELTSSLEATSSGDQEAIKEELAELRAQNKQLIDEKLIIINAAKLEIKKSDAQFAKLRGRYEGLKKYKEAYSDLVEIHALARSEANKVQKLSADLLSPVPAPHLSAGQDGRAARLHDAQARTTVAFVGEEGSVLGRNLHECVPIGNLFANEQPIEQGIERFNSIFETITTEWDTGIVPTPTFTFLNKEGGNLKEVLTQTYKDKKGKQQKLFNIHDLGFDLNLDIEDSDDQETMVNEICKKGISTVSNTIIEILNDDEKDRLINFPTQSLNAV